jgi:hypothetical protein
MDTDVQTRDQALKDIVDAFPDAKANGNGLLEAQDSILLTKSRHPSAASKASAAITDTFNNGRHRASKVTFCSKPDSPIPLAPGTAAVRPRQSRPLALTYIATAIVGLLFIGACGPVLSPSAFRQSNAVASSLGNWAPLPQGVLFALLLGLAGVAYTLRKPAQGSNSSDTLPRELQIVTIQTERMNRLCC